jgi:hypothetical protein
MGYGGKILIPRSPHGEFYYSPNYLCLSLSRVVISSSKISDKNISLLVDTIETEVKGGCICKTDRYASSFTWALQNECNFVLPMDVISSHEQITYCVNYGILLNITKGIFCSNEWHITNN